MHVAYIFRHHIYGLESWHVLLPTKAGTYEMRQTLSMERAMQVAQQHMTTGDYQIYICAMPWRQKPGKQDVYEGYKS